MAEIEIDLDDCFHDMLLVSSDAVFLGNPGDLGVRIYDEYLLIPREANDALRQKRIRPLTVGELFQYFDDSPQKIARALGWELEHVRYAHQNLAYLIHGKIDPTLVSFPHRTSRERLPDLTSPHIGRYFLH